MADCGQSATPTTQRPNRRLIDVLFVCDEWKSSKGGLSAFNREFTVNLAKISRGKINVHCYVSDQRDEAGDREDARRNGVNLITAQQIPGTGNRHDWLKLPPPELPNLDVVIGHGRKFGVPAYCIMKVTANCKLVQFVHVFCTDLGKYKSSKSSAAGDTIHENEGKHEHELQLCEVADAVMAVGPRLQQKYGKCLPDVKVEAFTPGIIDSFLVQQLPRWEPNADGVVFTCLVCGRAAPEDRRLKGYDIIANAIGSLGDNFEMVFVGSIPQEQKKLEKWFLKKTKIRREQLTIHSFVDQQQLKKLFRQSDVVALSSRTEGFGLVSLEAISADIPVLISSQAGISVALRKVEGGNSVIVESNNPDEWARRIQQLAQQNPQERHDKAVHLRENYEKTYSWKDQCEKFLSLIENLLIEADKENISQQSQESTSSSQSSSLGSQEGPQAEADDELQTDKEHISQQSQESTSSSRSSSLGSRKRPRAEADDELQKNFAVVLQASLWRDLGMLFGQRTFIESRGLKWGDVFLQEDPATGNEMLVLKNGGSQIHQEQGEYQALQFSAVRCYKKFERARPDEMKEPHSPFYLAVKHKLKHGDQILYMNKAQGVDKIGKFQPKKKRTKCPCP